VFLSHAFRVLFADITIYDEEQDRHTHIAFDKAMDATCYGHASTLAYAVDLFKLADVNPDIKEMHLKHRAKVEDETGTPITFVDVDGTAAEVDAFDGLVKATGTIKDPKVGRNIALQIIALVKAGVFFPVEIVICRPFVEHLMLSGIMTVAGRDTGATLFGPADMCAAPPGKGRERLRSTRGGHIPLPRTVPERTAPVCAGRFPPTPASRPSKVRSKHTTYG
jgi:hypothetical protein